MLIIRADGNDVIGAGHLMRCISIASAAVSSGCRVLFAVSDKRSADLMSFSGFESVIIGGDPMQLGAEEGLSLATLAAENDSYSVLVDSYAISEPFFQAVNRYGCRIAYIDDLYSFDDGFQGYPRKWSVDTLVNYSFGVAVDSYASVYAGSNTRLLMGPSFAPIRSSFIDDSYTVSDSIRRILVISGATNPSHTIEKMVEACFKACPNARLDVVIGNLAEVNEEVFEGKQVVKHQGLNDLSGLMRSVDIAVSAAGSTLYELCGIGVPTIALPIVDNQVGNARGFKGMGLGSACVSLGWDVGDIVECIADLTSKRECRLSYHKRMKATVDGVGAERIVRCATQPDDAARQ